jgi:hypothetical protein
MPGSLALVEAVIRSSLLLDVDVVVGVWVLKGAVVSLAPLASARFRPQSTAFDLAAIPREGPPPSLAA